MANRAKRKGTKNSHKKSKFAKYFTTSETRKKTNIIKDNKRKEKDANKSRHRHLWFIVKEKLEKLCQICEKIRIRPRKNERKDTEKIIKDAYKNERLSSES